ncbi:hypothetical protein [Algoriphagus hitonicola]|uniref:hypothetical protein n=1 Tax=Algoriphagus hitonicola TaxID=435880 RepID=UPI0011613E25|nr:hypothetical protein [Algoriphagus hitonicola]
MKKLFSLLLLVTFASSIVGYSNPACQITPIQGKTYEAGTCIEETKTCIPLGDPSLPDEPLPGDCFVEKKTDPSDPGIG